MDVVAVDVLDAAKLARAGGHKPADLQTPDGGSAEVAWSPDGGTLFAAGIVVDAQDRDLLLAWDRGGLGAERRITNCAPRYGDGRQRLTGRAYLDGFASAVP